MVAPLITGTASGPVSLPCNTASVAGAVAWGTVGSPTALAIINPGDVTAFVLLGTGVAAQGTGAIVSQSNGIPIPPGAPVFLAIGGNSSISGFTLRGGTQLTVIPST